MYFNILNNLKRRRIFLLWLIILIYHVKITESSMEFINENETEILSFLEQKLILQQDVTFEGSGVTSKIKLDSFFFLS
jgi:hypothetical protein